MQYFDKRGVEIKDRDVITDGKIIYSTSFGKGNDYLISCTHGYLLNITPELLSTFIRIGTFEECEGLLECD
jgi:hypothetical protein